MQLLTGVGEEKGWFCSLHYSLEETAGLLDVVLGSLVFYPV